MAENGNGTKVSKNFLIGVMGSIIGLLLTITGILIMAGISDIKATQTEQAKKQNEMAERLVRVETKVDQLNPDVGPAINRNGNGR